MAKKNSKMASWQKGAGVETHRSKLTIFSSGVHYAFIAAFLFGLSTPVSKLLLADLSPVTLAALLYLGSGLGLSVVRIYQRTLLRSTIGKANYGWFGGAILSGGVIAPVLLLLGLRMTTGAASSLLLNLEGVFTALLAWFIFRENFDRRIAVGMIFIVLGSIILSWEGNNQFSVTWGALAIVLACLFWGVDNNLTQRVSSCDPLEVASIKGLVAGSFNLILSFSIGVGSPPIGAVLIALFVGFVSYGLSLFLFVLSLRHIGTARTGAYFSLAPFFGMIFSLLLVQESVTVRLIAAGLLMGVGVWLHLTEKHAHLHQHSLVTHAHNHKHDDHHEHGHPSPDDPADGHSHEHTHLPSQHSHGHFPDIHHRHTH